jgi:putative transposase
LLAEGSSGASLPEVDFGDSDQRGRPLVYTTNAVESLHMSLRKIIKTRGSFPSEEAALKLLYLALTKVVAKWQTVQNWKQMLNHLDTACGDRMREAGVRQTA